MAEPEKCRLVNPFVLRHEGDTAQEIARLSSQVFPALTAEAATRGVRFSPVLLDSGGQAKQRVPGHHMRLTVELIDESRPFVIILIGSEYGEYSRREDPEPPDFIADNWEVAEAHGCGWVQRGKAGACSLLEVGAMHAVLKKASDPEGSATGAEHTYVYLRDVGQPTPIGGTAEQIQARTMNAGKIHALVESLQGVVKVSKYSSLDQLEELVRQDWQQVFEDLCPEVGTAPSAWPTPASRRYVPTESAIGFVSELDRICAPVLSEGPLPDKGSLVVVVGAPGSGKSEVLSSWAGRTSLSHPDAVVHYIQVGVTNSLRSTDSVLRNASEAFLSPALDSPLRTSRAAFLASLHLGPAVLVIDGVERLEDVAWVPDTIPQHTVLVLASTPAAAHVLLGRADAQLLEWSSLDKASIPAGHMPVVELDKYDSAPEACRAEILLRRMDTHLRLLSLAQRKRVVAHPLGHEPLFLSMIAAECRALSELSQIDENLALFLAVTSLEQLARLIVKRWSKAYGWIPSESAVFGSTNAALRQELGDGWVVDLLQLIAASQEGLSSGEACVALTRLGYRGPTLVTGFDLALLLNAAGGALLEHPLTGRLVFAHRPFLEVVEEFWRVTEKAHSFSNKSVTRAPSPPRDPPDLPWKRSPLHCRTPAPFSTQAHLAPHLLPRESKCHDEHAASESLVPRLQVHAALAATFFIPVQDLQFSGAQLRRCLTEYPFHLATLGYRDAMQQLLLLPRVLRALFLGHFGSEPPAEDGVDGGDDVLLLENKATELYCGNPQALLQLWRLLATMVPELGVGAELEQSMALAYAGAVALSEDPGLLAGVAYLVLSLGDPKTAEQLALRASELRSVEQPLRHALSRILLGVTSCKLGNTRKGHEHIRQALTVIAKHVPVDDRDDAVAAASVAEGMLFQSEDSLDMALHQFERAARLRSAVLGPGNRTVLEVKTLQAETYALKALAAQTGEPCEDQEEVRQLWERVLVLRSEVLGDSHPEVQLVYNHVGLLYARAGDPKLAMELFLESAQALEKSLGLVHPWTIGVLGNACELQVQGQRFDVARQLLQRARTAVELHYGRTHRQFLALNRMLVHVEVSQGTTKSVLRALDFLHEIVSVHREKGDSETPSLVKIHTEIANCYHRLGRLGEAAASLRVSLAITSKLHGDWSVETQSMMQRLEIVEAEARTRQHGAHEKQLAAEFRAMRVLTDVNCEHMSPVVEDLAPASPTRANVPRGQPRKAFGENVILARRGVFPGTPADRNPAPLFDQPMERRVSDRSQPLPEDSDEDEPQRSSNITIQPLSNLLPRAAQQERHSPTQQTSPQSAVWQGEESKPMVWPSSLSTTKPRKAASSQPSQAKPKKKSSKHRKKGPGKPLAGYR